MPHVPAAGEQETSGETARRPRGSARRSAARPRRRPPRRRCLPAGEGPFSPTRKVTGRRGIELLQAVRQAATREVLAVMAGAAAELDQEHPAPPPRSAQAGQPRRIDRHHMVRGRRSRPVGEDHHLRRPPAPAPPPATGRDPAPAHSRRRWPGCSRCRGCDGTSARADTGSRRKRFGSHLARESRRRCKPRCNDRPRVDAETHRPPLSRATAGADAEVRLQPPKHRGGGHPGQDRGSDQVTHTAGSRFPLQKQSPSSRRRSGRLSSARRGAGGGWRADEPRARQRSSGRSARGVRTARARSTSGWRRSPTSGSTGWRRPSLRAR